MNLVCLDSHYFKWAILRTSTLGQEGMIPRVQALFRWLDQIEAVIVVPTPIITELLMEADPSERDQLLKTIEERCHVVEFDTIAAKNSADIWNAKKRTGVIDEIRATGVSMKTKIKVDTMIIGTAMAVGVKTIYSEDAGFRALADGFVISSPIPQFEEQAQLPF